MFFNEIYFHAMEGQYIPAQFKAGPKLDACLVIFNTQEDKDGVELVFQKLLKVKKGKLTFGPPGTAEESLAYNNGYGAGMAAVKPSTAIVNTPDLHDADTGERLITGNKKRK
jgi:hypothetical protein